MTFSDTWNATYETIPSDSENVDLGASRIRNLKVNIRQRIQVDHSLNGDANDGLHIKATFLAQGADPTNVSGAGILYSKTVVVPELFYRYAGGAVIQLTNGQTLNANIITGVSFIPSGTKMLFVQASVPTGWTQDLTQNDRVLRIVSGAGGGVAGSWTISGLATQGHVLSIGEIPSHQHGVAAQNNTSINLTGATTIALQGGNTNMLTGFTGSGGAHDHGAVTADGTWRPAYQNVITGTKN